MQKVSIIGLGDIEHVIDEFLVVIALILRHEIELLDSVHELTLTLLGRGGTSGTAPL